METEMTTTDKPRTDTCTHCGAFLLTHHTPAYCGERTARQKAEAEVKKLKTEYWFMEEALNKEIAELKSEIK